MRVLLVHGAWSRASCWGEVPARLADAGHDVEAVDLPGHGADRTRPETVTLDLYAEALAGRLRDGVPAALIGHSMGGMVIAATAELVPEKVRQLIFVAAFLPRDGDSLVSLKRREPETIGVAVRRGPVRGTTALDPEMARNLLFQDLPKGRQDAALTLLGPQSNAAQTGRIRLSENRFGRVMRDYILCREDRTVTPWLQREMVRNSPCRHVRDLDCGHFPQLSAPKELVGQITALLACSLER